MDKKIFEDMIKLKLKGVCGLYIFGPSKMGWYVLKSLRQIGIPVLGFLESTKSGIEDFAGIPVLQIDSFLHVKQEQEKIIFALFNHLNARSLATRYSLENSCVDVDPFDLLLYFFLFLAERPLEFNKFRRSIYLLKDYYTLGYEYGVTSKNFSVSPLVTSNITQRCNLSCVDCGQRIPYYKDPKDFNWEDLVEEIQLYCSAFDLVPEISVHGGEPLLHKDLCKIVQGLSKIPNLIFINFITNSVITPSQTTLTALSKAGVDFHQSDYDRLTRNSARVKALFDEHNIYSDVHFVDDSNLWYRSKGNHLRNRTPAEHTHVYQKCISTKICAQIMDGYLYRCPLSAHGGAQGLFVQRENIDFIKITDGARFAEEVLAFLSKPSHLKACEFCDPFDVELVKPAIQIRKISNQSESKEL